MKIILSTTLSLLALVVAAQDDPVLMTINGEPVTRSEFEYSYNKNNDDQVVDQKSLSEYVQLFINYKLKVADAKAEHLDTLTSFLNEFKGYRAQQAETYFVDEDYIEEEARKVYEQTKEQMGADGMIQVAHILILLRQDATAEQQQAAKLKIDSVNQLLLGGADFLQTASANSDDKAAAQKGTFWIQRRQTLKEFEDVAFALKDGETSQPFLSPVGYHIVKRFGKKMLEPYEDLKENIKSFLTQRGIREASKISVGKKLAEALGGGMTPEQALAREDSLLEEKYPEFKNLMREYYDGLLLFEVSSQKVWDKASKDEAGLEAYFKEHKKEYVYDKPRYKGVVLHCRSNDVLKKAQKRLKKADFENYITILREEFNKDSVPAVKVERGPFKPGDNSWVDAEIFKQKLSPKEKFKDYPVVGVVGKIQKKRPDNYRDVLGQVTADYQTQLEKRWIEALRAEYKVVVNEEVLKTVNNHR